MVCCGFVWVILSVSLLIVSLFLFCSMILCVCIKGAQGRFPSCMFDCSVSFLSLGIWFLIPVSGCSFASS